MDEHNFEKSDLVAPVVVAKQGSFIPRVVWLLLILAVVSVGAWLTIRSLGQTTPARRPEFSLETQFVPENAEALGVSEALTMFGFTKSLPFFDEHNVVQSLVELQPSASATSTPLPFLSYNVSGQDTEALRAAFIRYFQEIGWRGTGTGGDVSDVARSNLFFVAPTVNNNLTKPVHVSFLEDVEPDTQNITVAVSFFGRMIRASSTPHQ